MTCDRPEIRDGAMGPMELAVYKQDWRASWRHRQSLRAMPAGADHRRRPAAARSGHAAARREDHTTSPEAEAPTPGRTLARLLIARMFDRHPSVASDFLTSAPIVVIDVPDRSIFSRVAQQWADVLGVNDWTMAKLSSLNSLARARDYDAIGFVTEEPILPKDKRSLEVRVFAAIQLALPVIAITPSAADHLPRVLVDAATWRLTLPPIDLSVIERTIRVVTGRNSGTRVPEEVAAGATLADLLVSVRFDRSPEECVQHLVRSIARRTLAADRRMLRLDDLHGLDDAVAWAKSTIADIDAWRRGDLAWEAIDTRMVLNGASGTAKTTFARAFARECGLPFFEFSYARWQGSGEGHLGHFIRQMRNDMQEARAARPAAVVLCDELDSFADRSRVTHSHKDYVVAVVNSLLEIVSAPDQRLIYIGCTNDVSRCDPALIRAGRFNRVIQVELPTPMDLEKIFRVYLDDLLADHPIDDLALLATGSTGADVERIVKDAKRAARQQKRPIAIDDLRAAMGMTEKRSAAALRRTAVHEGGHIILSVLHNGPADVCAVIGGASGAAGMVASFGSHYESGNVEECRRSLQILLAGRAAEEVEYGEGGGGNGAGATDSSDLATASRLASAMIGSYGLAGPHPLVYVANHHSTDRILSDRYMRMAVQKELSGALKEAKRLLVRNREALAEVSERLERDRMISGLEVWRIIERCAASDRRLPDRDEVDLPEIRLP